MSYQSDPVIGAVTITPSDTAQIQRGQSFRAVWVGGAGDMKVTLSDGSVVTFVGLAAGSMLPIRPILVWATGTTATSLLGVW